MKPLLLSVAVLSLLLGAPARAAGPKALEGVHRVVFLGDSITYSGQYVDYLETLLLLKDRSFTCEFINMGLPSETVSGLSEPGHAGGQFPRPDLHERLDRVLKQAKPDLIVVCYGMNDGIYYPFSEERSQKFQDGMKFVREHAQAAGAKVLHLTPPVFDPVPIKANTLPAGLAEYRKPYVNYDEVLERYGDWLLAQKAHGWDVVDIHGPMKRHLERERQRDPNYRLAGDGVHINGLGHGIITEAILAHWGFPADQPVEQVIAAPAHGKDVLKLVQQRQRLLKDAWLSATGHKCPGMARGLPLDEAKRKAKGSDARIRQLLTPAAEETSSFEPTDRSEVKQIEGWAVVVNRGFLERAPELAERTLTLLRHQLYQVERRLPPQDTQRYASVLRASGKEEQAYAATNPMEYFAEATEAFFGANDFYPFVRSELRRHDPEMFDLLKKLWNSP